MPNAPSLWIAAGTLWIMDAALNITMEPTRAFVGDNLPDAQRTTGYAMQSFFIGCGAVLAGALPWMLTQMGVANTAEAGAIPATVHLAFYAGGAALLIAVLWTVFTSKEYSPAKLEALSPHGAPRWVTTPLHGQKPRAARAPSSSAARSGSSSASRLRSSSRRRAKRRVRTG